MKQIVITARSNPKIKELKELTNKASARRSAGLFVCDGVRLCKDAALSDVKIVSVFITEKCLDKYYSDVEKVLSLAQNVYSISEDVMQFVSDTVSPQGIICTAEADTGNFKPEKNKKYIALDGVQNPDNLGAIIRTAEALGIDGIVISGGCDIYNPKALRASMGSVFRMPVLLAESLPDRIEEYKALGIRTFASVVSGSAADISKTDFSDGALVVIGNEGNGVSAEVQNACNEKLTIVMKGRAESLNAAQASSIIMWEMTK
ncbi:MAG: RNA methyltransferase [Oscillospiraceae bacterium]|nr:RNA methyltransferase [Oscillospiraceae bacterium]